MDNEQTSMELRAKQVAIANAIHLLNERRQNIDKWKTADLAANKLQVKEQAAIVGADLNDWTGKEPVVEPVIEPPATS